MKIDPKDAKTLALETNLSKLEENKTSVLATVQVVGGNRTQTHTTTDTKVRYPSKSYAEEPNNLEYWIVENQSTRISEITKIGIGVSNTRWKGDFM